MFCCSETKEVDPMGQGTKIYWMPIQTQWTTSIYTIFLGFCSSPCFPLLNLNGLAECKRTFEYPSKPIEKFNNFPDLLPCFCYRAQERQKLRNCVMILYHMLAAKHKSLCRIKEKIACLSGKCLYVDALWFKVMRTPVSPELVWTIYNVAVSLWCILVKCSKSELVLNLQL